MIIHDHVFYDKKHLKKEYGKESDGNEMIAFILKHLMTIKFHKANYNTKSQLTVLMIL